MTGPPGFLDSDVGASGELLTAQHDTDAEPGEAVLFAVTGWDGARETMSVKVEDLPKLADLVAYVWDKLSGADDEETEDEP